MTSVIPIVASTMKGAPLLSVFPELAILNVYIPHGNRDGRNLDYKLECASLISLDFANSGSALPLLICGDFNVARDERDLARPSANIGHIMFTTQERASLNSC